MLNGQLLVLMACAWVCTRSRGCRETAGLGPGARGRGLGEPSWAWVRVTGGQNIREAVKSLSRAQTGPPMSRVNGVRGWPGPWAGEVAWGQLQLPVMMLS